MSSLRRPAAWTRAAPPLSAVALAVCAASAAELGAVRTAGPPSAVRLRFAAPPADARLDPDRRSLLLVFDRPVPDGEATRVGAAFGPRLLGTTEGYAAIRYTFDAPVRLARVGSALEVTPEAAPADDDADGRLRLEIAEARVQAEGGDPAGARLRLQRLQAANPDKLDAAVALAELEGGQGRWQHALGVYDGVLSVFPEAADLARDRRALAIRLGPQFRLDGLATFGPGGERVQTATASLDLPLSETWRAGVSVQISHDEVRGLRQTGHVDAADYSGTKPLVDLDLVHDWGSRVGTSRVDLVVAPRTVGARLQHQVTTKLGETTLAGVYHQPYWGTLMAFAADARRDQLGVAQVITLPYRLQATLGAGLVRYGLPRRDDVASGPSVTVGLSEGLPERWLPREDVSARVGWRMEAEYLGRVATGASSLGALPLLDVRKRENHDIYADLSAEVWHGRLFAEAGYVFDRFGGNGPQAVLRYTRGADSDRLALGAEAGVDPSLDIRTRTLFHVGAFAVLRLGGP